MITSKAKTAGKALILFFILCMTSWNVPTVNAQSEGDDPYEPDRLLVQFRPGAAREAVRQAANVTPRRSLNSIDIEVVDTPPGMLHASMTALEKNPNVEWVSYDYLTESTFDPNDPLLVDGTQYGPQRINAPAAWDISLGSGVTIAVVDSGVDLSHPDLVDRLVPGYDIYDDDDNPVDGCGHGTIVAGVAAATGGNAQGIAGIAPDARIMPVRITNDSCNGSYSRIIDGIVYAADNGARVIVVTSGAGVYNYGLHSAVTYARSKGAIVITAAGNRSNSDPFYPGSHPESFNVSATNQDDTLYSRSNFGDQIDVTAPGQAIHSTHWTATGGSTYAAMSGTSTSAPHVAGVAALILSQNPGLSVTEVEELIAATADDLGDAGWDPYFGAGIVNAGRALQTLAETNVQATTVHVADLDAHASVNKNKWEAGVSIQITDDGGAPVAGATVAGSWSVAKGGQEQCTTDSNGWCTVSSGNLNARQQKETAFTVGNVAHPTMTYSASANAEPDGDSNGTSIVVKVN